MERRKVINNKNGGEVRRFVIKRSTIHNIYRYIINQFYPNICPCCEEIIDYNDDFCDECKDKIVPYNGDFSIEHSDFYVAYCFYTGKVRNAIRKFKYEPCGNSYYAFAFGILQALRNAQLSSDIDLVTYIPMTKEDKRRRGYNQTEMIAKEIYYQSNIPCLSTLVKTKNTKNQKSLNEKERRKNLKGVFSLKSEKIDLKGKCVLIVDDLCTTGSTLSEATRILKEAGAEKVITASFAKTKFE